jgi:hypothetical protein
VFDALVVEKVRKPIDDEFDVVFSGKDSLSKFLKDTA